MKLSMEQHAQLKKLARYFDMIEEMAKRTGIEVDTLVEGYKQNNSTAYLNLKENLLAIANRRQHIFKRSANLGNSVQASIVNLNVIVNEERF